MREAEAEHVPAGAHDAVLRELEARQDELLAVHTARMNAAREIFDYHSERLETALDARDADPDPSPELLAYIDQAGECVVICQRIMIGVLIDLSVADHRFRREDAERLRLLGQADDGIGFLAELLKATPRGFADPPGAAGAVHH